MTLNVGFLGYKFMGKAHANALARLPMFFPDAPDVHRDVIIGRDEQALTDAADQLGFSRVATDWEEVVDDVDVFYNLGPNHLHAEPSIAALDADVPVLCEKPLATTYDQAEQMAAAAEDSNAVSGIAFNYRFVPALRYAKQLIEAGELGDIQHFHGKYFHDGLASDEATWSWRNDEDLAGSGALGDLGAHTIDLARWLVGDIERISGHLKTFVEELPVAGSTETREVTVDDTYSAQAEFTTGALGTLEATRYAPGHKNDHSIEIHGTDGSLKFSLERLNEIELLQDGNRGFETTLVTDDEDPYIDHWWPPGHILGWEHTFVHENYEFLSAVVNDGEYHPNFADGKAVQRVISAIKRSDASGQWVQI